MSSAFFDPTMKVASEKPTSVFMEGRKPLNVLIVSLSILLVQQSILNIMRSEDRILAYSLAFSSNARATTFGSSNVRLLLHGPV